MSLYIMQGELIVCGLVLDIVGVVVLVVYSDRTIIWTLGKLGLALPQNWAEIIGKAKERVRRVTIIGTGLLAFGFFLQIIGNLV